MSTASSSMSKEQLIIAEQELGLLAMRYRDTAVQDDRNKIVQQYAQVVEQLANSGRWDEVPPPEDQLPDDVMPDRFEQYREKQA